MKIAIAQLNYLIGDFQGNVSKIKSYVETAKEQGADLIIFGELATCGYPPRDFLEFNDFIVRCEASIEEIKKVSAGIGIAIGSPSRNPVPEGKDLFNSVYFIHDGEVSYVQHKALLPTYDVFDEYRYFEPGQEFKCLDFKGKKIAFTVCEDIWDAGLENPLYQFCPLDKVAHENPDFIINVSASPFNFSHAEARIAIVKANVEKYKIPMFYTNHVGAQTELIFDGGSLVVSPNGKVHRELPYFSESMEIFDLDEVIAGKKQSEQPKDDIAEIHDAIVCGIKDYFGN